MLSVPIEKNEERKETKRKEKEMTYNYEKAVRDDVRKAILEGDYNETIAKYSNLEELVDRLDNAMWTDDYITGNGSGSYTMDLELTKSYLVGNEYLIVEALRAYGAGVEDYQRAIQEPDFADVNIRRCLLSDAIWDVLEEPQIKRYVQSIIGTKKVKSNNKKPVKPKAKKTVRKPAKRPVAKKKPVKKAVRR